MKLRIKDKWQWLAMDKDGKWYMYTVEPTIKSGGIMWINQSGGMSEQLAEFLGEFPNVNWQESLHKREGDEWVPYEEDPRDQLKIDDVVEVRIALGGVWVKKHYSGTKYRDNGIFCWEEGRTSHTTNNQKYWPMWRLPC